VFTLTATYNNITAILSGKMNPMTAMMTSKLKVKGNLGYMMRNVPTVLDFVRVAQEVTKEIL
jgi:putative sterol carrier protein